MTDAAAWAEKVGRTWADEWPRTERAFAGIAAVLDHRIAALAPVVGSALDVGSGAGSTALVLAAARPGLTVIGADLSPDLVAVARDRAAGRSNCRFVLADVRDAARDAAPLDLVVSRHGVMFFDDPVSGFAALRRSCRPGMPLIFTCFRARVCNEWSAAVDRALGRDVAEGGYTPGPYALADDRFTGDVLARAGWVGASATALDVPYIVGAGTDPVNDALSFYSRIGSAAAVLAAASPPERTELERRLAALLATRVRGDVITFTAAIWLWTAFAGEPA